MMEDAIVAPATVPGTGAISIIRLSGQDAFAIADKVVSCLHGRICDAEGYTILFGRVFKSGGELLDEVLVNVFRAPHSYTGEDSVEISCHASSYIAGEIISMLIAAGARSAQPGEFTRRAFLNGKMDLSQAEAVADVIAAQNAASHRIAINQMKGGMSSELASMREELLEMVSLLELELDFSEEDVEFADRTRLLELVDKIIDHIDRLADSFRLGNAIRTGIPVAIVGATNAGKSTLLNALLGEQRAIVSDVHGTTRDTIEETLNIDGVLFRFIDTAGLRATSDTIEKIGIERTLEKLHSAEIVIGLIDGTLSPADQREAASAILSKVDLSQQTLWIAINKCDLDDTAHDAHSTLFENTIVSSQNNSVLNSNTECLNRGNHGGSKDSASYCPNVRIIHISARTGAGIDSLKASLAYSRKDILASSDTTLVTNIRHHEALTSASTSLRRVKSALASSIPADLVAEDLRDALRTLGTITGEITTAETLQTIFSRFCVGK